MAQPITVQDHLLYIGNDQVPFIENPVNKFSEDENTQEFIVVHTTESLTAKEAHNTYLNPEAKVSWHLTIDRDGNVWQLLGFDKIAWHAGVSQIGTGPNMKTDLNRFSIGIELVNAGPLKEDNGSFYTAFGQVVPIVDVFIDKDGNPWQKFHPNQLAASKYLITQLAKQLQVKDIVTHAAIARPLGRRRDPGPAYMETFNAIRNEYMKTVYNV